MKLAPDDGTPFDFATAPLTTGVKAVNGTAGISVSWSLLAPETTYRAAIRWADDATPTPNWSPVSTVLSVTTTNGSGSGSGSEPSSGGGSCAAAGGGVAMFGLLAAALVAARPGR